MEEQGLWDLFWATGLPEAWLEVRLEAEQEKARNDIPCGAPADGPVNP